MTPLIKPKYENTPVLVKLAIRNKAVSKPSLSIAKKTNKNNARPEPATAILTEFSISFRSLTLLASQKIT